MRHHNNKNMQFVLVAVITLIVLYILSGSHSGVATPAAVKDYMKDVQTEEYIREHHLRSDPKWMEEHPVKVED